MTRTTIMRTTLSLSSGYFGLAGEGRKSDTVDPDREEGGWGKNKQSNKQTNK